MTVQVTDANFRTLLAEGKPMLVDFWAPWCGPCKMMSPVVDEIAAEYEGKAVIGKLNVDENPETCEQFGIMSIPTMLFFRNGELADRHVGACRKADLQQKVDALL